MAFVQLTFSEGIAKLSRRSVRQKSVLMMDTMEEKTLQLTKFKLNHSQDKAKLMAKFDTVDNFL